MTTRSLLFALLLAGWLIFPVRGEDASKPSSGTPLDATKEEIVKFYGPVVKANARIRHHQILEGTVLDGDLHGKNGFIIRVVYYQGRSVLLEYTRVAGQLKAQEATTLLNFNAGGSAWEEGKDNTDAVKSYHRLDDKAIAHWAAADDGSLLIAVEDSVDALDSKILPRGALPSPHP